MFLWVKFTNSYKQCYLPNWAVLQATWNSGICTYIVLKGTIPSSWETCCACSERTFLHLCPAKRGILNQPGFPSSVCNSVAKWQWKKIIGSQINRNLYSLLLCNYTFQLLIWELSFSFCAPTLASPLQRFLSSGSDQDPDKLAFPFHTSAPWNCSACKSTLRVSALRGSQKLQSYPSLLE